MWQKRVSSWRASGETAAVFSARQGFSAHTLRWWSSRLGRGASTPVVRMAQLVRSPARDPRGERGAIVVEGLDQRVRITIETGADRDALAVVLGVVGSRLDR